ncbi:FtsX-like permease family protein [Micromonospora matsumotoense]|uniref:FtsX-like permease family protein n=1 Tax=Micromonospora matsumotoense TaxID=121616 RepID=A0A1C5ATH2_9ACTN|nr:ABC transporter permease [Micromonospora matsumotoense]SCF48528.1 FtsX-like permease family protein [Micromonospora matsumotoense]
MIGRGAVADLVMGARMAVTGGREGWTRALLTAVGVGIGVAMLLLATAVPGALDARQARGDARDDLRMGERVAAGPGTLLVHPVDIEFRGRPVRGRLVRPEGPAAPVPPGLTALPGPGEVVVSPALRRLLDSPAGPLFAPRLGGARVTGTIADEGLAGPHELAYYLGDDRLTDTSGATRLDRFGGGLPGEGLGPVLMLLVAVIFVVLLLPIAVFLGSAVRYGGERRDRRLAALRLVGADTTMVRRIAAGEAAAGALLGVAVGIGFLLAGRQLVPLVTLYDISVYASDIRPPTALLLAVVLAVPALAVLVAMLALRAVVVEPLGVTRRGTPVRRRLWWRLLLPAAGLAVLLPVAGLRDGDGGVTRWLVPAGAVLLLIGTVTLLPWLTDLLVRRLRGGPVPWQLAVRRVQLDSATSARLVNGIAVAVAGTIGLQMLFAGVAGDFTTASGQDTSRAQAQVQFRDQPDLARVLRQLGGAEGVTAATGTLSTGANVGSPDGPPVEIRVGDCAALAEFARLDRCADGDTFLVSDPGDPVAVPAGAMLTVEDGSRWRVPTTARTAQARPDPAGWLQNGVLVTPGAVGTRTLGPLRSTVYLRLDPAAPDAVEHVRNATAAIDLTTPVSVLSPTIESPKFADIRRGLAIGTVVTLVLIATSMLVGTLEQLRERRRLLAMLVAVGTRRSTLGWSVLWQTALPVGVGLVLAVGFGLGLGAALLRMVQAPVSIAWPVVGFSVGLGALTVLAVTGLSLPLLWRLTRADGLRTE